MTPNSLSLRVLVVDDEVLIADTLTAILRLRGHDASAVYSAEQALAWCSDQQPDVVITDVIMGPINGVQLAIALADSQPDCRLLLVSGDALTSPLLKDSKSSGYQFAVLTKPVHPTEILDFLAGAAPEKLQSAC